MAHSHLDNKEIQKITVFNVTNQLKMSTKIY